MSLLTIVQNACDRLGFVRPSSVVNNSDQNARVLLGLANEEGRQLARRYPWQAITREHSFGTVADQEDYTLPTDFDRIINDTFFNRTQRERVGGPISAEDWQHTQASMVNYVNPAFRFRGNEILITPTPEGVETFAYEYISKNWCSSADGNTLQDAWNEDADLGLLDEELMTLGVVWRFLASRGMDYAEAMQKYEVEVYQALLRDGARPRITTSVSMMDRVPVSPRVPETLDLT